ncbi:hypothetical protein [Brevundimonas sp. FT23042]|jgi:hypothetical protein|uniref:hypothetical protein n=1 Tax=Brevundimonas sp. FT23042 TaxID=3393749 RepID=UPI003B58AC11
METYPNTVKTEWKETPVRPLVSVKVGAYLKQRPNQTRWIKKFETGYSNLTDSQKEELELFFQNNQTLSFNFIHPRTGITHKCQFDEMEELDFTFKPAMNSWTAKVKIVEV